MNLMNQKEAAAYIGVSYETMRNHIWIQLNKILIGKRWYVPEEELQSWVKRNTLAPKPIRALPRIGRRKAI